MDLTPNSAVSYWWKTLFDTRAKYMTVRYRVRVASRAMSLKKIGFPRDFSWRAEKQFWGMNARGFSKMAWKKAQGQKLKPAKTSIFPWLSQWAVGRRVWSAWSAQAVLAWWLWNTTWSSLPPSLLFQTAEFKMGEKAEKQQIQNLLCVCVSGLKKILY